MPKVADGLPCPGCGQLTGVEAYDEMLWDVYHRLDDGRSHRAALSWTASEWEESIADWGGDEEAREIMTATMERDMHERGLCTECGRPDLSGVDPSRIMSREDADALADMHAEREAERRAGCG